ncbi:lambda-like phage minor tail protein L [Dyella jiangningensis]|uniref:phage minor tail protein L n=1 Tax=Dyella sp. AtDHG13 TaxID=1938897 RepID=UPI000889975C|nr:phage minor tail protein L [Dyella sp. AtDHG13]PXV60654.1 lambda family phage minor tail protein L [Dyella sp. AtDHG13]SDJ53933.1 lambda-like phage minor tail protein L [Dyella jiangningensis]
MSLFADVQQLEPGAEIWLVECDSTAIGGDLLRFHGYCQVGTITWQGNQYSPWPLDMEGFERTSAQQPTPKLTVGNIDATISALCLLCQDMVGAKITVHLTTGKYLDAVNFPGGNPTADPTQEAVDVWLIERKASEDNEKVQFELSSPLNFQGMQLPARDIVADVCPWVAIGGYRGVYCGYTGGPVADINDQPTSDPTKDACSGTLAACKMRFGASNPLPFGGFPAAGLLRT